MARKNTWKSPSERKAEREADQAEHFDDALKIMDTPLGRALRKPGVTFCYWSNSSPANVWVESKKGTHLFHSDENDYKCPVKDAFRVLRSFLDDAPSDMGTGGDAYVLSPEFIAQVDQLKLDAKTAPAPKPARIGPRL